MAHPKQTIHAIMFIILGGLIIINGMFIVAIIKQNITEVIFLPFFIK